MRLQRDTLLGLVFFAGLAGLGWATMSLSSLSFEERQTEKVYFDDAFELRKGDPVFVLGKRIGQVTEVVLRPAETPPLEVELQFDLNVELGAEHRIEIRESSALGGRQVNIFTAAGEAPQTGGKLLGQGRPGALTTLGQADLLGTIDSVKQFFDMLVSEDGSVGALLKSREVYEDLAATIKSARTTMEEVERGEGTVGKAIYSNEMADDLASAIRELRDVAHKVNEGVGLAARLINDVEMSADVAQTLADLKEITAGARRGEGVIGRLLSDPAVANKFDALVDSVTSAAAKLDDPGAGLVGALLADQEMHEDGRALVANLADASRKINEGEGVLGRLISDEELGQKLDRLISQVTGAIEDARESAPVSTLFQVVTAPF